jgi:2',3'-cyclic-nucleotide 2'-phosphodiesterase
MRIVYFGDIVGRSGRTAVLSSLDEIRRRYAPDFIIANGENAAHGFGITEKICAGFFEAGIDVLTLGNHAWDQREIVGYIGNEPRLLRPNNYPELTPGNGFGLYTARSGKRVLVIQVMGRLFMEPLDDPFASVERALRNHVLGRSVDAIVVDVHAEATSEKQAMGVFLDGRVSMVVGSHSHVPTADARVLPGGTAYQTDAGMCGDYDSVIGMKKDAAVSRFIKKIPGERLEPAEAEGTVCAVLVETDDATGLARSCQPLRLGRLLQESLPEL